MGNWNQIKTNCVESQELEPNLKPATKQITDKVKMLRISNGETHSHSLRSNIMHNHYEHLQK